ncbi:MAG: GNAT family N-acetyltransferase [Planctomycetota bacterium]|jgi:GNAT superfamily N-acetyltransferase
MRCPDTIRLRPATRADLGFLRDVQFAAMRPHVERVYGAWDVEAQRERFHANTDPASHTVIEWDGEPVGCQWVRRHEDALELVRLYLLPAAQGCGIGTYLVKRLIAEAGTADLPVRLRVLKGNPARRLYERLGFVVIGETETHDSMERAG